MIKHNFALENFQQSAYMPKSKKQLMFNPFKTNENMKVFISRDKCYILTFLVVLIAFLFKLLYAFIWFDMHYVKLLDFALTFISIILFTQYLINSDFKIIYSLLLIGYSVGYIFTICLLNINLSIEEYVRNVTFYFIICAFLISLFLSIKSIYMYAVNLSKKDSMFVKEYNSELSLSILFMLSIVPYINLL